jgi:hypothetical protein
MKRPSIPFARRPKAPTDPQAVGEAAIRAANMRGEIQARRAALDRAAARDVASSLAALGAHLRRQRR